MPSSVYSSGLLSPPLHPRALKRSQSEYMPAPGMLDECRASTPVGIITSAHASPHTPLAPPATTRRHSLLAEHLPRGSPVAGRTRSASRSRVTDLLQQSRQNSSSSLHRLAEEPWLRGGEGLVVR